MSQTAWSDTTGVEAASTPRLSVVAKSVREDVLSDPYRLWNERLYRGSYRTARWDGLQNSRFLHHPSSEIDDAVTPMLIVVCKADQICPVTDIKRTKCRAI
jgi:hypothetical protein